MPRLGYRGVRFWGVAALNIAQRFSPYMGVRFVLSPVWVPLLAFLPLLREMSAA
jgi:hypothetical protein